MAESGQDESLRDGVVVDVQVVCPVEDSCFVKTYSVLTLTYLLLDVGDEVF